MSILGSCERSTTSRSQTNSLWASGSLRGLFLKLEYSKTPPLSCSFGPESKDGKEFWIGDLLFMYEDRRYRELPQSLVLDTETDVESWFRFIADVFKQYGREVLSNRPGIFDRLAQAQAQRDAEFVAAMNEKYGNRS